VIDFPELQDALVDAARRRHAPRRRARRVLSIGLPVAATAAAVAAVILVLSGNPPSDEQPVTPVATLAPTDALSRMYEVFRRPPTTADALPPGPRDAKRDPDRARLLFERGNTRVYAVAAANGERPAVCVLWFAGEIRQDGTCSDIIENPALGGRVTFLPVLVEGRSAIAALASDDISELELEFGDGSKQTHRFADSALLAPAEPWPTDLSYRKDAGGLVGIELTAEERPVARGG
jgi:hypothetical protein